MGLKLIHSIENQEAKPRVFVVAETDVFESLAKDLALDVYPVLFNYETFIQATLTKSISVNNAIVIVSDSLSQKVVPLEAVVALVRDAVVLIPWNISEDQVRQLNVACASRRPTLNTLRRSIFNHIGLNEPPARYDGDQNLSVPQSAQVVEFGIGENSSPSTSTHSQAPTQAPAAMQTPATTPAPRIEEIVPQAPTDFIEQAAPVNIEIPKIEDVMPDVNRVRENIIPSAPIQDFAEPVKMPQEQTVAPKPQSVEAVWVKNENAAPADFFTKNASPSRNFKEARRAEEASQAPIRAKEEFISPKENFSTNTAPKIETPKKESTEITPTRPSSEYALPDAPSFTNEKEVIRTPKSNETFGSIFGEKSNTTQTNSEPLFAFGEHDSNGNQSMWSMYESKDDLSDAKNSLNFNDFPEVSDSKKQISLKEPLVICVYSPKGGVGKTSISVNMAARLAYTTRAQVCIVDLDIGFGNVGTRLGLYNPTVRELLAENHLDSESLARNLVYDRRSGLFALLAPLRPETGTNRRKFSPATYNKILDLLTQRFDIIILDCPVELRDPLVSGFALTAADKVAMVVNNEQATLLDARRALEAMCRSKESQRLPGLGIDPRSIGLIVNQKVDNVGREVEDVIQVISGSDHDHPSRQVDVLAVIEDDRELWVGNANMARTVATSGENAVDIQLDQIWSKLLPSEVMKEIDAGNKGSSANKGSSQLDDILSNKTHVTKKRKFLQRKKDKEQS